MTKVRGVATRKRAAELMLNIRRENVKRHEKSTDRSKLRDSQVRAQRVATMQMELDRLHASAVRGNGLDKVRIDRVNVLKQVIGK